MSNFFWTFHCVRLRNLVKIENFNQMHWYPGYMGRRYEQISQIAKNVSFCYCSKILGWVLSKLFSIWNESNLFYLQLQNFYFHPLCIDGLIQLACFIWNWQRKFGHQSCWRAARYILGMEVKWNQEKEQKMKQKHDLEIFKDIFRGLCSLMGDIEWVGCSWLCSTKRKS